MSSPLQFVSLGRARRGRRTQRGWNYHKDTENTELKFKKIEELGVSGGLHEIWSQRGDRFQCNGTPGTAFKSEKERLFALLDQTETAPYYEYIISSFEA
ncbi:MAG: hypothetical protein QOE88_2023 [Verrucomicrobiota bacterium]|nr:hypothetical protein [Verrucomicrobiota bacterium]